MKIEALAEHSEVCTLCKENDAMYEVIFDDGKREAVCFWCDGNIDVKGAAQ